MQLLVVRLAGADEGEDGRAAAGKVVHVAVGVGAEVGDSGHALTTGKGKETLN